ncbi:MAG: hypothetical protein JWL59_1440 [Chthoniobacteraceae bacterium]|nr:hypothetical protein [Chthoniobacteraceae bacterium]
MHSEEIRARIGVIQDQLIFANAILNVREPSEVVRRRYNFGSKNTGFYKKYIKFCNL